MFNNTLVRIGRQFRTGIGVIDILAKDSTGCFVVIELKRNQSCDSVIGQLYRYIGWVKKHLSKNPLKPVKGIVICDKLSKELKYALLGANDKHTTLMIYDLEKSFRFIGVSNHIFPKILELLHT